MATRPENLPEDFEVRIAHLSDVSQAHVIEAVADADANGEEVDVDAAIADAEEAAAHRAQAAEYEKEEAKAIEAGDFAGAREYAVKAEHEHALAAEHGGAEQPILDAQHDIAKLDEAVWHDKIADENALAAESYAKSGDLEKAEAYQHTADAHESRAVDQAHEAHHPQPHNPHDPYDPYSDHHNG